MRGAAGRWHWRCWRTMALALLALALLAGACAAQQLLDLPITNTTGSEATVSLAEAQRYRLPDGTVSLKQGAQLVVSAVKPGSFNRGVVDTQLRLEGLVLDGGARPSPPPRRLAPQSSQPCRHPPGAAAAAAAAWGQCVASLLGPGPASRRAGDERLAPERDWGGASVSDSVPRARWWVPRAGSSITLVGLQLLNVVLMPPPRLLPAFVSVADERSTVVLQDCTLVTDCARLSQYAVYWNGRPDQGIPEAVRPRPTAPPPPPPKPAGASNAAGRARLLSGRAPEPPAAVYRPPALSSALCSWQQAPSLATCRRQRQGAQGRSLSGGQL